MRKKMIIVLFALALFVPKAWGYEAVEVKDGGTLKGTVKVTGNIPKDETVSVTKDKSVCGDTLPREKYIIGPEGGVKNAVVFIKHIEKGKKIPDSSIIIDNKKCAFHPHVQGATRGQTIEVTNDDPMLHNTHIYLNKKTFFNAALPIKGMHIKDRIKKSGLMSIECDVHSWMKGYIYVVDHPYITVTDENGKFSIAGIPPGTYEIEVWHEALGEQEHKVTIDPDATVELNVDYKK